MGDAMNRTDPQFGMNAMGAAEKDFQCAGMCVRNNFYTFSEVEDGLPYQHCADGATIWTYNNAKCVYIAFWIFGSLTALFATYIQLLLWEKRHSIHSPLLGKE